MTFIDNSAKTNWKFIGIVAILAVLIGGGILVLSLQKEAPSPIVETAKPNVVTEDETADWQTYRNAKYGYEVKYPPMLVNSTIKLEVASFVTEIRDGPSSGFHVYAYENPNEVSVEEWCDEANQDYQKEYICNDIKSSDPAAVLVSKIRVNDLDITVRDQQTGFLETYFTFSHGEYVYNILDSYFGDIDEAKQMLSTFKFIAPIDTPDWQTYRNEEFGFEMEYPGNYCLSEGRGTFSDFAYDGNFASILDVPCRSGYADGIITFSILTDSSASLNQIVAELRSELEKGYVGGFSLDLIRSSVTVSQTEENIGGAQWTILSVRRIPPSLQEWEQLRQQVGGFDGAGWVEFVQKQFIELAEKGILVITSESSERNEVADQILSTFRFIEPIDTSDWQTYRNEEFSFEVKHPEDWTVQDTSSGVLEFTDSGGAISILIEVTSRITNYCGTYVKDPSRCEQHLADDLYGVIDWEVDSTTANVLFGSLSVTLTVDPSQQIDAEIKDLFRAFLSTFRFVESTDTSYWQTYRNDEFGFEVKYPFSFRKDERGISSVQFDTLGFGFVNVRGIESELTLEEFVDEATAPENNMFEGNVVLFVYERYEIQVGERKAIYLDVYHGDGLANPGLTTYIEGPENSIVRVWLLGDGSSARINESEKEAFDQFLSTFRFIE